jgi:hypothetical protein
VEFENAPSRHQETGTAGGRKATARSSSTWKNSTVSDAVQSSRMKGSGTYWSFARRLQFLKRSGLACWEQEEQSTSQCPSSSSGCQSSCSRERVGVEKQEGKARGSSAKSNFFALTSFLLVFLIRFY